MYDIGIIGGMGPKATSKLLDLIVECTDAKMDQDHPSVIVLSNSKVPDRTNYLLGISNKNPISELLASIETLNELVSSRGAIGMVCNTAHYFMNDLLLKTKVKFVDMPLVTLQYVSKSTLSHDICILGTKGTVETGIYDKRCPQGITIKYPTASQQNRVQKIIYEIKNTSNVNYDQISFEMLDIMKEIGKCTYVLACTELSTIDKDEFISFDVIDAMDMLALSLIISSGYRISFPKVPYNKELILGINR